MRGLPLPLSVDNVAAGASLGLLGFSPWLAPPLFGVITFVMSVAGHQIGRAAAHFIPRIRTDLLTGIAFVRWQCGWPLAPGADVGRRRARRRWRPGAIG